MPAAHHDLAEIVVVHRAVRDIAIVLIDLHRRAGDAAAGDGVGQRAHRSASARIGHAIGVAAVLVAFRRIDAV
jgi:hypothetical protein